MRHICQNVSVFFNIFSEHFFHIFETVNEYGTTFLLSWCLLSETVTIEMLSFSNNIISVTRASLFVFQRALATSSWYKQVNFLQNPFESLQYLKDAWHLIKCIWQLSVVLGLNEVTEVSQRSSIYSKGEPQRQLSIPPSLVALDKSKL